MSIPENELSKFTTYSTYHSLIMCDGMRTADVLYYDASIIPNIDADPELLFDVQSVRLPSVGNRGEGTFREETDGKFVMLIDGRNSVNFFIKSVKWETILAPKGKDGESKFESIETEGEMVVEEPFGVDFLRALVEGTREMGVDPSNVVFMLKTYFVGFDIDGQQHMISNIQPFTFIMIDLTSEMKASGSTYNIALFGTTNGVAHLPQISAIANGLIVEFNRGDTVEKALKALSTAIRTKYEKFKEGILPTLVAEIRQRTDRSAAESDAEASRIINETYQDVRYKIELAPSKDGKGLDYESYIIGTNEAHDSYSEEDKFQMKFGESATVDSCIRQILQSSRQVLDESTEDPTTHFSYTPKIVSKLVAPEDEGEYQVTYTINRYETLHVPYGEPYQPQDGEAIIFDYIYTGKNVDVLDFDIKLDMGLSFFQTQLSPTAYASTQEAQLAGEGTKEPPLAANGSQAKASDVAGTTKIPELVKAPLFLGAAIPPSSYTHKINHVAEASFDQALVKQAALESIQARIKITGNPQLLNEVLERNSDFKPLDPSQTAMANMYKKPGYVKVNVKFPATKELTGVKPFWYDGYFTIFSVINEFDDGKFTQEIEMFSVPVSSSLPRTTANVDLASYPSASTTKPVHFVNRGSSIVDTSEGRSIKTGLLIDYGDERPENAKASVRDKNVDLWYKKGVDLDKLSDEIKNIFDEIVDIWAESTKSDVTGWRQGVQPVITSANDSAHKKGSKHYSNHAIDVRANNLHPDQTEAIAIGKQMARALAVRIGNEYDVIFEVYQNYSNNHFHIEYDPKPISVRSESPDEQYVDGH